MENISLKSKPKDGDYLKLITENGIRVVIYKDTEKDGAIVTYAGGLINGGTHLTIGISRGWGYTKEYNKANDLDKMYFNERLEKEFGVKWNKKYKCFDVIYKRVKLGMKYFYVDHTLSIVSKNDYRDELDNMLFDIGNYFIVRKKAEEYADKIGLVFKDSKHF